MAYSELIKSFERIRDYMREFFVYGFKSREEYSSKSTRSYDNERRRLESWLGDFMSFRQGENGKNVFITLDARDVERNPLFKAFRARSFTDKDLILYFYVLDILQLMADLSASEIHEKIMESYLHPVGSELDFDLSTLRKKLKEFELLGLIRSTKSGNRLLYSLIKEPELDAILDSCFWDTLDFFSEEAPLGVIGSYIVDRSETLANPLAVGISSGDRPRIPISYKHHYILDALDSEILLELITAIREHKVAEITAVSRRGKEFTWNMLPIRIFVSTQQGRYYVLGYRRRINDFDSLRIDSIHSVKLGEAVTDYDEIIEKYRDFRKHLWGVAFNRLNKIRHVEMDVQVNDDEAYIIDRLRREARCGKVLQVNKDTWRYAADVYDTLEMLPWIRTFTGRITRLISSDGELEEQFYEDLAATNRLYAHLDAEGPDTGIRKAGGGAENVVS